MTCPGIGCLGGVVGLILGLSGCALISGEEARKLAEAMAQDQASACLMVSAWGGAGAITPGPGMIPAIPGAAGAGFLYFGRANMPGSKVTITAQGCTIEPGSASPDGGSPPTP